MTEKVKFISNPLTIIAIFAALAEINATVSIGLVDKDLQQTFIWFVIVFPTLLIILFFLTLNFNTKVIYAPSDYKTDESFQKMFLGEPKPDKEINFDKDIIRKTIQELGIKKQDNEHNIDISQDVQFLFGVRYNIEKELRRISSKFIDDERPRPIMTMLTRLVEQQLISPNQHKVIRNLYSIASPAIHGDEQKLTVAEIDFAKQIAPGIIEELKKIE
ncbi:hypothetical protein CLV98_1292 [Dyadobacter jejuensis]|uniref:Uncharacterized protein n=1 Tax=Dyadobacter jejuensis TaxID=1082580 RepID=A0A316A5X0_9BACT|nr:hypothetical protein [Dyadobacter jejuensis]PWJ52973.1 hypothetical protein CLV98_1292 [Dyadobacter jejuensis]